MFYGFDQYTVYLVLPTMILALVAQFKVKSTFNRFSKMRSIRGLSGADVARQLLRNHGILDVQVMPVRGVLTDHYDPRTKTVRLSEKVYHSQSVAAVGVAAHETGHAMQHHEKYSPLVLRSSLVPLANIGSSLGPGLAIAGLIFSLPVFIQLGIILFALAVAFYVITLPVEFNASFRAIQSLPEAGIITDEENRVVKKVLTAAALTYVASAAVAIANLIRLIMLSRRE